MHRRPGGVCGVHRRGVLVQQPHPGGPEPVRYHPGHIGTQDVIKRRVLLAQLTDRLRIEFVGTDRAARLGSQVPAPGRDEPGPAQHFPVPRVSTTAARRPGT
ncbi:hypothetical protein GCM10010390_87800 [Streptomyces mordarskii]|uniref:Uncharacterized protein n=1 Tax=Streptomyces mordarskii TaxID=1226758 RepID=A0ABP3PS63_9ACTN